MTEQEIKFESYLIKYIHHELTPEEFEELKEMLSQQPQDRQLLLKCLSMYKTSRQIEFLQLCDQNEAWQLLCQKRTRLKRRQLFRQLAYAAMFILLIGGSISGYLFWQKHADYNKMAIEPGARGKVTLTLADGRKVVLGEGQKVFDEEGKVVITDSLHLLSYQKLVVPEDKVEYHELNIPRGAAYSLVLADGTKVWLNSDSYLRFPMIFPKDSREVELIGEAYFEVTKDEHRPFIVNIKKHQVEVLGTHFNVSAYQDDKMIYTTLAEGKVQVRTVTDEKVLIPGEQAGMNWEGEHIDVREVDAALYTSWHLGIYEFRNMPLAEIVTCLNRWYDVDIRLEDEHLKNRRFTGAFKRDDPFDFTIKNLEKISGLKFIHLEQRWLVEE